MDPPRPLSTGRTLPLIVIPPPPGDSSSSSQRPHTTTASSAPRSSVLEGFQGFRAGSPSPAPAAGFDGRKTPTPIVIPPPPGPSRAPPQQTSPVSRKSADLQGTRRSGGGRLRSTSLPGVAISGADADGASNGSGPKDGERVDPFAGFSFDAAARTARETVSTNGGGLGVGRDRDRDDAYSVHTRESTADTTYGGIPATGGGRKGPTWLVLQDLMGEFVRIAEVKSASILGSNISDRDADLSSYLRPGVDLAFDRVVSSLGRMSRHYPKLILDSVMVWRKTKSEAADDQDDWGSDTASMISGPRRSIDERSRGVLRERRSLVANFILCRVLLEIIRNNESSPRGLPNDLGAKLEDMLFGQLINSDPELLALAPNRQANFEMFAEVIGALSRIRFSSVTDKFAAELPKLSQAKEGKLESFLGATRFLNLKLYPVESLEESADFIETLAHHFHNAHSQRTKQSYAEVLVEVLEPLGAQATAEVNVQSWAKAIESLYSRALKLAGKPRHYPVGVPLLATTLSVAPKNLFLNNWSTFVDYFLTRLKEKNTTIRRLALASLARVVWVYLFRCGDASLSNVQRKLEHIFRYLLPPRRRDIFPSDTPGSVEVLSRMVAYVGNKHWEYAVDSLILPLLSNDHQPSTATAGASSLGIPGTMATMATTNFMATTGAASSTYATFATGVSLAPSSLAPSILSSASDETGDTSLAPERMIVALRGFLMMLSDAEAAVNASMDDVKPSRSRAESTGSTGRGLSGRVVMPVPQFPGLLSDADLRPSNVTKLGSGDWEFLKRASAAISIAIPSVDRSVIPSKPPSSNELVKQSSSQGFHPDGDDLPYLPGHILSITISERMGLSAVESLHTVNSMFGRLLINTDHVVGSLLVLLDANVWSTASREKERDDNYRLSIASAMSSASSGKEGFSASRISLKRGSSGSGLELNLDGSASSSLNQSSGATALSASSFKKYQHIELARTLISCIPRCCPTSLTPEFVVDLLAKYLLHADEGIRRQSALALLRIAKVEEDGGDSGWWVNDPGEMSDPPRARTPSTIGPRLQWMNVEEMVARVCTESSLTFISDHMSELVAFLGKGDDFDQNGTGNLFDNNLKTIVRLSELWAAERKDAFISGSKDDQDSADSPKDPDAVNMVVEDIESWGLTLLLGPIPPVRKYGLQLLRIAANLMDETLGPPPSPPAFLTSPIPGMGDPRSFFDNPGNKEMRIVHIMENSSDELVEKHFKGISVSVSAGETAKLQEVARRARLSGKQGLATVATSEDPQDAGIWYRCVSDLTVLFAKHASVAVLTMTLTRICRQIAQMLPHIVAAADQTTPAPERSGTSTIVSWATTPYRVLVPLTKVGSQAPSSVQPATDDMIQQWSICLIFAMAALDFLSPNGAEGPQWEGALRRDQPGVRPMPITSSKALFQLVLPLLSAEKLSIRAAVITALGNLTSSNYYPLFQELQPLLNVIAEDHNQRFGGSGMEQGFGQRAVALPQQPRPRSTSGLLMPNSAAQTNAALKKIERLRTEVAHLFSLTSCFMKDEKCRNDPAVLFSVAQYILQGSRFLSDPTVQTDWGFLKYRYHFCGLVEELYKLNSPNRSTDEGSDQYLDINASLSEHYRGSPAETRVRQLFSSEMRHVLFKLAESWCGHGPMGPLSLERDTRTINTAVENIRDPRERSNLAITMHEQRQLLEYAALKCMSVLLQGPLVATDKLSESSSRDEGAIKKKGRHSKNVSEGASDDLRTAASLIGATDEAGAPSGSFNIESVFLWIESLFKGSDQTIQGIGRVALKSLIESSKDDGALIVRFMKHCFVPGNAIFDRACFTALANAMSTIEDFRCRLVRQLVLALTKVADESIVVRKSAIKLIGSVQTRILADEQLSSNSVRSPPVSMDDSESTLACSALPGDSETVQRLFSVRLAMSHPEQSLETMSELFYWLDVVALTSVSPAHTKTKDAAIKLMLRMLVPWVRNLNLASAMQWDVFVRSYSPKNEPNMEDFQNSIINGLLTNVLVLSVRYIDRFTAEIEALWRNFLEELSTVDLGLRAYQSLEMMVEGEEDTWTRGIVGAAAHLEVLLDFLLTIGTTVRNNNYLSLARQIIGIAMRSRIGGAHLVERLVSEITIKNLLPPKVMDRAGHEPEDQATAHSTVKTFALSALTDSTAAPKNLDTNNKFMYVADLERELVSTPRRPPYSRAQLAAMLLRDLTYTVGSEVFLEHLPILVHTCVVHFDASVTVISEDLRTLFYHLIRTIVPSSVDGAVGLAKRLEEAKGQKLWANEDVTPTADSIASNAELTEFVMLAESVFSAVDEDFGQKWGEVALLWSTTSSIRHTACRSLEVFRAIMPAVTLDMLGDFLARLGKTVGARSDEAQGFALEALNTMKAMVEPLGQDDIMMFPQFFWTCVAALQSPHEWEFLRGAEILDKILRKLDLKNLQMVNSLKASLPRDWNNGFSGLQPLLLKGLASSVTEPISLTILNYLIQLDHNLVDNSGERVLFCLLANLPRMLNREEPHPEPDALKDETTWNLEADLAALARGKGHEALAKQLSGSLRTKFRTKADFLGYILKGVEESFFPAFELPTLRFVLGLLGNSKEIYRRNSLQILKVLIPRVGLAQYMDLIMGEEGLLTPLLDLLRSDLAPEVLEVLDALLGQDDLSDLRYIFSSRKIAKMCRNSANFDVPNPVPSVARSVTGGKEEEVNLATGWRVHDREKASELVKYNLGVVAATAYKDTQEDQTEGFMVSDSFAKLNRSTTSLPPVGDVPTINLPEPGPERTDISNTLMQNLDEIYSTVTSRIIASLEAPQAMRHQRDSSSGSSGPPTRPVTPSRNSMVKD